MRVYKAIKPLVSDIKKLKKQGKTIGFVPTMGFLHEGHISLIRKARKDTDFCVVSIFVNPIQFGPKEDFNRYPKDLNKDISLCRKLGVDIVFAPDSLSMYKNGFSTYINVENLTKTLCGASRPGHFRGVTTIVVKLFNIISPDIAYFGQKDLQQVIVIKKMIKDLDMNIKVKIMPIVREKDGLAISSRNVYLNHQERKEALSIPQSLKLAKSLYRNEEKYSKNIVKRMRVLILQQRHAKIDYISIVDTDNLKEVDKITSRVFVAISVRIGKTRLIDNIILGG